METLASGNRLMLLLSRYPNQRAVIRCPDGNDIWIRMRRGYVDCTRNGITEAATRGNGVYYDIGEDTVEILYKPRMRPEHQDGVGIEADKARFQVWREELLDKQERTTT